jgi:hypothetical protein
VQPRFLHDLPIAILDLQHLARLPHREALPDDVERTQIVARGHQPPRGFVSRRVAAGPVVIGIGGDQPRLQRVTIAAAIDDHRLLRRVH